MWTTLYPVIETKQDNFTGEHFGSQCKSGQK